MYTTIFMPGDQHENGSFMPGHAQKFQSFLTSKPLLFPYTFNLVSRLATVIYVWGSHVYKGDCLYLLYLSFLAPQETIPGVPRYQLW